MKNKALVYVGILIIVCLVAGLGFYFLKNTENPATPPPVGGSATLAPLSLANPYVGDDFTFIPPTDWILITIPSTLAAYQNPKETQPQGSAAEKIHFKSYVAVSFDNANGQKLDEITNLIKRQIKSVAPTTSFTSETDGQIDGQPAKFMEADLFMQDVNFKVMVALVLKGDKFFTISNNTTTEKWPEYRDIFYGTAESFKFKY
ncbi:MAG: hypothetical protein Q8M83_03895 [bacterium]|nr:hypothetical protein [bacterium]